jgi:hypothetical protein
MPRTTAVLGIVMLLAPLGCATTVQAGLANAPALGTSPVADASVRDVVANGRDSCERALGQGPLWHQLPPCPGVERPAVPTFAVRAPGTKGVVMPWVEHYYSHWPCSSWETGTDRMSFAGLASPARVSSDRPLSALTCNKPL